MSLRQLADWVDRKAPESEAGTEPAAAGGNVDAPPAYPPGPTAGPGPGTPTL
jgi:hypothetical protein